MAVPGPVVLKLGGSLLTMPQLLDRITAAAELLGPQPILIVPGGGAAADSIRSLHQKFSFSAEKAHRDAIAAMSLHAAMLCRLSSRFLPVNSRTQAETVWQRRRIAVLDTQAFLDEEEQTHGAQPLPALWDVTSDSIAAWVALRWPACHLVLGKSCDLRPGSIRDLSREGLVDAWFPEVCESARAIQSSVKGSGEFVISWMNLRSQPLRLAVLQSFLLQ